MYPPKITKDRIYLKSATTVKNKKGKKLNYTLPLKPLKPCHYCNHYSNKNALAPKLDLEVNHDSFFLFIPRDIRIQLLFQQTV